MIAKIISYFVLLGCFYFYCTDDEKASSFPEQASIHYSNKNLPHGSYLAVPADTLIISAGNDDVAHKFGVANYKGTFFR
jgi:hypothetical protein